MNKDLRLFIPLIFACTLLSIFIYFMGKSSDALAFEIQSNLVVTTLEDVVSPDGFCSLREAINAANTNSPIEDCGAGEATTDTITFEVLGTIVLTSQLSVTANGPLVIDGGDVITTSGGGTTRVWLVVAGSIVTLSHLTVVDGYSNQGGGLFNNSDSLTIVDGTFYMNQSTEGGGVYNLGSIKISDSNFLENNASAVGGGIRNYGTMTISTTTFTENSSLYSSGAIDNFGTMSVHNCIFTANTGATGGLGSGGMLVVTNSTFTGNTGGEGGGIALAGEATITDSTFTGNTASNGGGISSGAYGNGNIKINNCTISGNSASHWGGGININGETVITNSTISGNSSSSYGGGIFIYDSLDEFTFIIFNSSIAGNSAPNGGGISGFGTYGYGSGTLSNTIVANNQSGSDCNAGDETLTDGGHNLDSDNTCGFLPGNGSLPGVNPLLGPLQDNGGHSWTHALLPDSPAIDSGDDAQCPVTDQRGMHRPLDGNNNGEATCDMGAFEAGGSILTVTTLDDETVDDGICSLREAIDAANTDESVDNCGMGNNLFDVLLFEVEGIIHLANELIILSSGPLMIEGEGEITLSGSGVTRLIMSNPGSNLILSQITIEDGFINEPGAGLFNNNGTVEIQNSTFTRNNTLQGGAIENNGMMSIMDSTFTENSADNGGGIHNSGILYITNSTIFNNDAVSYGGGIFNNAGLLTIVNSTISQNGATSGGGIYAENGSAFLSNSIIADSSSGNDCGTGSGTITDGGYNLDSDGSCGLDSNLGSLSGVDPLLGTLKDNGGSTQTIALHQGSPAIDAVNDEQCPPRDQRGFFRPGDGNGDGIAKCDMGSYENIIGHFLVNTLSDNLIIDNSCSLREALKAANENIYLDGCGQGDVLTDTILFDVSGTITIMSQLSVLDRGPLVIDGGNMITVAKEGTGRVWQIEGNSSLRLKQIKVAGGRLWNSSGGGLLNEAGDVTIENSIFWGNSGSWGGGGIYNAGSLTIINSTFTANIADGGYAGGILNEGILTMTNSILSENQGYRCGGLYNSGVASITGSTIYGNTASWGGSGLCNEGGMTIINSTVSNNSSSIGSGGGIVNLGTLTITNSTITGNSAPSGGGIYGGGSVTLANTIIANNPTGGDCAGTIIDGGFNLDSDNSCGLIGDGSLPGVDPLLGPLQDNGGLTWTHALLSSSPAIDAGLDSHCPSTDQRGISRPQDGNRDGLYQCDIGSYEVPGLMYLQYLPISIKSP